MSESLKHAVEHRFSKNGMLAQKVLERRSPSPSPPTSPNGQARAPSVFRELLFLLIKIAAVVGVFLLIFTFIFGMYRNTDPEMSPAVADGDLVIFYRLDKNYATQNALVLVFDGEKQVRRVVATAGDTVEITEDGLIVNGAIQQEPDIYFSTLPYEAGIRFPITLKEGEIFVLGDHRTNATDSRVYGVVETGDTLGKVMAILRRRGI
ncbi:MAG TPA: signal peptidase I [Clostridiales bacterium]|nr:signal peptidase I [Clostridiales bacterium]